MMVSQRLRREGALSKGPRSQEGFENGSVQFQGSLEHRVKVIPYRINRIRLVFIDFGSLFSSCTEKIPLE
jgi:hypothetical protein